MLLHHVKPIYFSYFQESFRWFKNKLLLQNTEQGKNRQTNILIITNVKFIYSTAQPSQSKQHKRGNLHVSYYTGQSIYNIVLTNRASGKALGFPQRIPTIVTITVEHFST